MCPEYLKIYDGKKFEAIGGCGQSVDRDALAVMRHVDFDADWKPLTLQDMENHKWNLKWLKACVDDNMAVREDKGKVIMELPGNRTASNKYIEIKGVERRTV